MKQDQAEQGEWQARVLVRDKRQSKTFIVNSDFVAVRSGKMRMDITTPLGIHVASVALDGSKMTYVVPQKKAFYEGQATAQAFSKTLNFALDPKLILNVLFDQPVQQKGWTCKSENELVSECSHSYYKIKWTARKGVGKTVTISHSQYQVDLKFNDFDVPKNIKEEIFTIQKPEGFDKVL